MLSIFFTEIMAAVFDFMAAEGWGRTTIKNTERGRGVPSPSTLALNQTWPVEWTIPSL